MEILSNCCGAKIEGLNADNIGRCSECGEGCRVEEDIFDLPKLEKLFKLLEQKEMKNREIKFRCWDEIEETMVFFDLALCSDESGRWWDEEIKDNPIMQYTGLKDKNGKEIYEGDIVRRNIYTIGSGKKDMSEPFVIIWDGKKAGFEYDTDGYQSGLFHETHEVIGNIYENSNLSEQKK